jgi:enoyl-CoA hydratase
VARDGTFGVFCRRWGVPLIDGGTVRLPRLIGHARALDLILTGREVGADEALAIGLANRVVDPGAALSAAITLATEIARFPQDCLRMDRASSYEQWSLPLDAALVRELREGREALRSSELAVDRFVSGEGRHGTSAKVPGPHGG